MRMGALKMSGSNHPDYVEMDTAFTIGEQLVVEYDWSEKESCMNGYRSKWHKDIATFTVKDIFCNKLVYPNEVMVTLSSKDEQFISRCNCTQFDVFENQLKDRIREKGVA